MAMVRLEALYGRPVQLVRNQIRQARDLPAVKEENIVGLIGFATTVQNLAMFLDTPTTQHHLTDPTLLEELVRNLPMGRRIEWAADSKRLGRPPNLIDFPYWVTSSTTSTSRKTLRTAKPANKRHVLLNVETVSEPIKCAMTSTGASSSKAFRS